MEVENNINSNNEYSSPSGEVGRGVADYGEEDIKHLSDMEHIRLRPGMYIGRLGDGSHAEDGIYVLLKEVIDNSIDEFKMNAGRRIEVDMSENLRVSVRDYGRGIPLGSLIDAVSMLNTGGTCYKNNDIDLFSQHDKEHAVYIIYDGDKNGNNRIDPEELDVKPLQGDGDFRSRECVELLKQSDIVVTNPPFSLFREYVKQLMDYGKQFLIIGHQNAITYKEIFPYIMHNRMWLGYGFSGNAAHFYSFYKDTATAIAVH